MTVRLGGMENLHLLETVFTGLVVVAALGAFGVGIKVVTNLFKVKR
ncbi:hypothetical protein DFO66_104223 [Brevibacterium sanguinis]|uniref:Uncharacterized protein n=2 Tax=Brevibacterium TaxID=1696 RepID=A0A366ILX2_9MICO|nr:hypothetical protein DFO66_104223 [Brevibacterium sanguinis]RBP72272.1 hypothetical protein DFO65_104229 [Brevibacterium celere]